MERVYRPAARAVLLTPAEQILLLKLHNPHGNWTGWITPGGGIAPGEQPEETLRRELFEEVGLTRFALGPAIWRRRHTFPWQGQLLDADEIFYLVRAEHFEPRAQLAANDPELAILDQPRWWTLPQLQASREIFAPPELPNLLGDLLRSGPPLAPLDVA
ncbi:MAG TPA: NUDIX domain-containing protein [Bdellovibrionales bacterium]|nr:NUDIX domain-containing protein [Bdellovibrionales bacterium]